MIKYYLSSLDSSIFDKVRECTFVKKMSFDTGKECALVKLKPGVDGRTWGYDEILEFFVIANRHQGEQLFPVKKFPCFVYITRLLNEEVKNKYTISSSELQIIAWGELYKSRENAKNHIFDDMQKYKP